MRDAAPSERPPAGPLSPAARVGGYVTALTVLAAIVVAALATWVASVTSVGQPGGLLAAFPWALGLLVAFLLSQGFGFPLLWRGHRVTLTLDEGILLCGFLLCPEPALLPFLAALAALLLVPVLRRGGLRSTFNVAHYVLAGTVAWLAFLLLTGLGASPLVAALLAPLGFTLASNLLVAGVLASLDGVSPFRVFRDRFVGLGAGGAVLGLAVGLLAVNLWALHPLTLLGILPFLVAAHRYSLQSTRTERELAAYRRLAAVAAETVGSADLGHTAGRLLAAVGDLFPCGRATLAVAGGSWSRDFGAGPHPKAGPRVAPLLGPGGAVAGELRLHPQRGDPRALANEDEELLRRVASRLLPLLEATRALGAVVESRDRLGLYLSSLGDPVLLAGPAGNIAYLNPSAQRLFHLTLDEAQRVNVKRLFEHPRLCPTLTGPLPSPVLLESAAVDVTGTRRFVLEVHASPVVERGASHGTLIVARDITERKRLDNEVGRQRDLLARQEKLSALGAMVASVAHEINNPLTYMKGAIQIANEDLAHLKRRPDSPDAAEVLGSIERQLVSALEGVDRLADITRGLKAAARSGKGTRRVEDLNDLARDVVSVLRMGVPRHLQLTLEATPGYLPASVNAAEIHQVLMNLVKNASEALGDRAGRVVVRTATSPKGLRVEVEDNGPGIPEHVLKNLFTPFFTTKDKGTGLGLSISQEIVRAHGGELRVATAPGKGTRFTMLLPHPEGP